MEGCSERFIKNDCPVYDEDTNMDNRTMLGAFIRYFDRFSVQGRLSEKSEKVLARAKEVFAA